MLKDLFKRTIVILLSFMMAIQVIPFSMYGIEGVMSNAAGDNPTELELHPVGGRIWSVLVTGDVGATYEFYNWDREPLNLTDAQKNSVADLSAAAYYTVEGSPTKDKYSVLATTDGKPTSNIYTKNTKWGFDSTTEIGASSASDGEYNTNIVFAHPKYLADTPSFQDAKSARDNNKNGCNDWYFPSANETYYSVKSKVNNTGNWQSTLWWSSTESSGRNAKRVQVTGNSHPGAGGYGWGKSGNKYPHLLMRKFGGFSYKVTFKCGERELGHFFFDAGKTAKLNDKVYNRLIGGYNIEGWYTEPELQNEWDLASDTVSADTILYANGDLKTLNVPDVSAVKPYNPTSSQNVTMSASNGYNYYTFTIVSADASASAFTISGANVVVPANTGLGTYHVKVCAEDKYTHAMGVGLCTVTIDPAAGSINLSNGETAYKGGDEITAKYDETLVLDVSTNSGGNLTASIADVVIKDEDGNVEREYAAEDIADINLEDGKLTITPKELLEDVDTTLTISAEATETYSAAATTYNLSIIDKTTPTSTLTSTSDVADHQIVTLEANDFRGISSYYFGTDESKTSEDADIEETEGINEDGKLSTTREVSGAGTYYFVVEDDSGNRTTKTIEFFETLFNVTHGSISAESVLIASGDSFELPEISADTGYSIPNGKVWKVGDAAEATYADKEIYKPSGSFTLNASCEASEITLEGDEVDLIVSAESQFVDIKTAQSGTGSYTYSILEQPGGNFFRLVNDGRQIEVPTDLPTRTYIVKIKAVDNNTAKETTADYVIKMTRLIANVELSDESPVVFYPNQKEIQIEENTSGGELSVISENKKIAKATISDNAIVITPGSTTGITNIHLMVAANGLYDALDKVIPVEVKEGEFEITEYPVDASANGIPHAASLSANVDGVTVVYGTDKFYENGTIWNLGSEPQELKNVTRTTVGTTTVYYEASKPGYKTVTGQMDITLVDDSVPVTEIMDVTHDAAATQTLKLSAYDNSGIDYWYFGKKKNPASNLYEKTAEPLVLFERTNEEVDAGGTYYFIVKDQNGTLSRSEITFVKINVSADDADVSVPTILAQKGVENEMPIATAKLGYTNPPTWELTTLVTEDGDDFPVEEKETVSSDAKFVANGPGTLKTKGIEIEATLTYDNRGLGGTTADAVTMSFTKETTAAAELSANGYVFKGWSKTLDGKSALLHEGDIVKEELVVPENTVLYAIWEAEELDFADTTIENITASEDSQLVEISGASKGSGDFRYEVVEQPNGNYFQVSGDSKIEIAANTPADEYKIKVQVTDNITSAEAIAVYTLKIDLAAANWTLSSDSIQMDTEEVKTVEIINPSNLPLTVSSSNENIITADISADSSVIITAKNRDGSADVIVRSAATDIFAAGEQVCHVLVGNREFTIEATPVSAEADGTEHAITVVSSHDDVEFRYGLNENNLNHRITIESAGAPVALSAESRVEVCNDTIYYRAIKDGYKDVTGNATIKLTDNVKPTGHITEATNEWSDKQTVTLDAYDVNKVAAIYFGTDPEGTPVDLPAAVYNFERKSVDVASGEGTYYFIVKDGEDNVETVATMDFYMTTYRADFGEAIAPRLTASGNSFPLPTITPKEGYLVEGVNWTGAGVNKAQGDEYQPTAGLELKAELTEMTANLSYDNKEHGGATENASTLFYTKEATAAAGLSEDGYTFLGWTKDIDNKGYVYQAGEKFKEKFEVPVDTTLYAKWVENKISLSDQAYTITASEEEQTRPIVNAKNGTHNYHYTIADEGQTDNYFSVRGDSEIVIAGNTPVGKHTVTLDVIDTKTSAEANAVYTFNVEYATPVLELSSNAVTISTDASTTVNFTKTAAVSVEVATDNPEVATAELSGDSVIIKSTNKNDSATITVTTGQTNIYKSVSKAINVKVENKTLTVTPLVVFATADGTMKAPTVKASVDDVELRYGVGDAYNHVIILTSADEMGGYRLDGVKRAQVGTKTIKFKANKPGYTQCEGSFEFAINAGSIPQGDITDETNEVADHQTVTLTASDPNKITGFYFGTKEIDQLGDGDIEPITPLATFERENVEVKEPGIHYLIVTDGAGRTSQVASEKFYETKFAVLLGGHPEVGTVLTHDGKSFPLPKMIPDEGYTAGTEWGVPDSFTTYDIPGTYTPYTDITLEGVCIEKTAKLYYSNNGYGGEDGETEVLRPAKDRMRYTKVTTAEAAISADGYTFLGWNTKEDGTGITYKPGDIVKQANVIPTSMTLFAKWLTNDLIFEDQTFDITASEEEQLQEISGASNGTGKYEYSIPEGGQTAENYFSVNTNDGTLTIDAGTPVGKYDVTVKAIDTETSASATKVCTFNITHATPELELSSDSIVMYTDSSDEVNFTKTAKVELALSTDNPEVAFAEISGDSAAGDSVGTIIINSLENEASADITVKTVEDEIYESIDVVIHVTVNNKQIEITPVVTTATADAALHAPSVKSDIADVELRYGVNGKYDHVLTITSTADAFELSGVARSTVGTTTITYKANKSGYAEYRDSFDFTIHTGANIDGSITEPSNAWSETQTVTLRASDPNNIVGIYFGTNASGEPEAIEPVPNFVREKVEVKEGPGTYYFRVKDGAGRIQEVATLDFYKTTFAVTSGDAVPAVLTASDNAITLPTIVPIEGYKVDNVKWTGAGDPRDQGSTYTPTGTLGLSAVCEEISKTLTYDRNGHGTEFANTSADTMWYTKKTTLKPAMTQQGYTFEGWNTDASGNGVTYAAGDVFKEAYVVPEDTTLYAVWLKNEITLDNKDITISVSENAQYVEISSAAHGTGHYVYSIPDEGQVEEKYFSVVSGDSNKIKIAGGAQSGKYTVTVNVIDTETGKTASAVYTFHIEFAHAILEISADAEMLTDDTLSIPITYSQGVELLISSSNRAVASAVISSDSNYLYVTSTSTAGQTDITIKTSQIGDIQPIEKKCTVKVNNRELEITHVVVSAEADNDSHAPWIQSDIPGVEVFYGLDGSYDRVLNIVEKNIPYELKGVSRKTAGTTHITYKTKKSGYAEAKGEFNFVITDNQDPTGDIIDITKNVASKQTVTLTAHDNDQIKAFYFGREPQGELTPITPTADFLMRDVEVTGDAGTYYFRVQDNYGDPVTVKTLKLYKTTFVVNHGGEVSSVLIASGDSFNMPSIVADEGYKIDDTVVWKNGGLIKALDEEYIPSDSLEFTATCADVTAMLYFDCNGHGTSAEPVLMTYSATAEAKPALSVDGYDFIGWNTKSNGKGDTYQPGDPIKGANVVPKETTLYAKWAESKLGFNDQEVDLTASEEDQYEGIIAPTKGTESFIYSIPDGGQTDDYFGISDDSILIKGNTPAGKHTVTVNAKDRTTSAEASAVYTFIISRATPTLTLASTDVNMETASETTVGFTKSGNFGLTFSSDMPEITTAELSSDSILIKSTNTSGDAIITVNTEKTEIYESISRTINVRVSNRSLSINKVLDYATANGEMQAPVLSSNVAGVELRYGVDGKLDHVLTMTTADSEYRLNDVERAYTGVTTIEYIAIKPGYGNVTGTFDFTIVPGEEPTGAILDATKNWSLEQTVTLQASNINTIVAVYFGRDASAEPVNLPSPVVTFERKNVDVEGGDGVYHLIVKDGAGRTKDVAQLEFFKTAFEATHGEEVAPILTASGDSFELPTITAKQGYKAEASQWKKNSVAVDNPYQPTESATLKATCDEIKATLTYVTDGHGTVPADQEMTYTDKALTASTTAEPGYKFEGWNTSADGKSGETYAANEVFKAENVVPVDTTLYAKWSFSGLTFDDKTAELIISGEEQLVEISGASNGTGEYNYSIPDAGQTEDKYFTASGDSIVVSGDAPVGTYDVTVVAEDNNTHVTASAIYTIEIKHDKPTLTLSDNAVEMLTDTSANVGFITNPEGLEVEATSTDLEVARVSVVNETIVIKSTNKAGKVQIKVATRETAIYESVEKVINVTVNYKEIVITAENTEGELDGSTYTPSVKANVDDVEFRYGENGNYNHVVMLETSGESYELPGVARKHAGNIKVTYNAIKEGYAVSGDSFFWFKVKDETKPNAYIKDVTKNVADKQTVTLNATDNDQVVAYYFGTNKTNPTYISVTPTVEFTLKKVLVTEGGRHYFMVRDSADNVTTVYEDFFNTTFNVVNGEEIEQILVVSGESFALPTVTPNVGYEVDDTVHWKNGTTIDKKQGETYKPADSLELKTECIEKTALLHFDRNEHGVAPADVTMKYTEKANTRPALTQKGYKFVGWNETSSGSGKTYAAGALYKDDHVVPVEATLYAVWEENELEFANQKIDMTASESEQTKDITAADNGTGYTKYSVVSQTSGNYFAASSDGKIHIKAGTPAGKYTVTVEAEDTETHKKATAVYTFNIELADPGLQVNSDLTIETEKVKELAITKVSNGELSVKSSKTDIATAEISGNSLVIKSTKNKGTTDVTVTIAETDIYKSDSKTCHVTVNYKTIGITDKHAEYEPNLVEHTAWIKSKVAGVEVRYGETEGIYNHVLTIATAETYVELPEVTSSKSGQTNVYYKATKEGYNPETGHATINIATRYSTPQITNITNNMENKQTVTLEATDEQLITGYYFGTKSNGTITKLDEPVWNNWKLENVEVNEDKTYYLRVENSSGQIQNTYKTFYKPTFYAEHGTLEYESVLVLSGNQITFPTVSADTGYTAVSSELEWIKDSDYINTYATNANPTIHGSYSFKVSCNEMKAELVYNSNGHGGGKHETDLIITETLRYTREAKARAALSADGYTFLGWTEDPDWQSRGIKNVIAYKPGEVVKKANEVPRDIVLYAMWQGSKLTLDDKVINMSTSENAQLVEISTPSNGTGKYTYAVVDQDNENNYFTLSGDSSIAIKAKTPAGKHLVTVRATDKKTNATADATYTFNLSRIDGTLKVASAETTMAIQSNSQVGIENLTGGSLTATSNKPGVVVATISGDSIILNSTQKTGTATVTVKSGMTDIYNPATATCKVTVKGSEFNVTSIDVSADANGYLHAAKVRADEAGIELRYGSNPDNLIYRIAELPVGDEVELTEEAAAVTPNEGKTIYYRASKTGCDDITGEVLLTVVDKTGPAVSHETTTDEDFNTTITLIATDNESKIAKYYFGPKQFTELSANDYVAVENKDNSFTVTLDVNKAETCYFYAVNESNVANATIEGINFYKIKFTATDGTSLASSIIAEERQEITLPGTKANKGHNPASKWTLDGVDYDVASPYMVVGEKTFTTTCPEKTAKITYKANNGDIADPQEQVMKYSEKAVAAAGMEAANDKVFVAWNTESDGTGTKYRPGDTVKRADANPEALTLYAIWRAEDEEPEEPEEPIMDIGSPRHSLTVGSDLSVNFYFNIPEKYKGGQMTFTIDNDNTPYIVTGEETTDGTKFTCKINVNQMCDGITWDYTVNGKTCSSAKSYSFYTYLDTVKDNESLKNFCSKLKAYGYYAQNFIAETKPEALDHASIPEPPVEPENRNSELSAYTMETSGSSENISSDAITRTLLLDSTIALKLILPMTDKCEWTDSNKPSIKVDGKAIDPANVSINGRDLEVTITDIKIRFLDQKYTVEIGDELTIKVSALVYANLVKDESDGFGQKFAWALYELWSAAKNYK